MQFRTHHKHFIFQYKIEFNSIELRKCIKYETGCMSDVCRIQYVTHMVHHRKQSSFSLFVKKGKRKKGKKISYISCNVCNAYFQADFVIEVVGSQHSVPSAHTTLDKEGENDILTFERLELCCMPEISAFKSTF